jgi:hypothetical protein
MAISNNNNIINIPHKQVKILGPDKNHLPLDCLITSLITVILLLGTLNFKDFIISNGFKSGGIICPMGAEGMFEGKFNLLAEETLGTADPGIVSGD